VRPRNQVCPTHIFLYRYIHFVLLGRHWDEIREIYLEQLGGLETLQQQVEQSMEHLKLESESLARVDETIRQRRENLRHAFEQMEKTQRRLQDKGMSHVT
jgi:hypothetical protein